MEHVLFEYVNINLCKARKKFEEGYCTYVDTQMYKPLLLKTKENLNLEPQSHKKDIEKGTSLICTFLKSVYAIVKNYESLYLILFLIFIS